MGRFGRWYYSGGAWQPLPSGEVWLGVEIYDGDFATVDYFPSPPSRGRFYLGYEPRTYFDDPDAGGPVARVSEASAFASWAKEHLGRVVAPKSVVALMADPDADDFPDDFVEDTVARLVELLGLPALDVDQIGLDEEELADAVSNEVDEASSEDRSASSSGSSALVTVSKTSALKRISRDGIESVLVPAGFRNGQGRSWLRSTSGLQHVVYLGSSYGRYSVEWGVTSPVTASVMWGAKALTTLLPGYSVMAGNQLHIRRPSRCAYFSLEEQNNDNVVRTIAADLSDDIAVTEEWLRQFDTRKDLRDYLLLVREKDDKRQEFLFPTSLSFKLLVAAALAFEDGDPEAPALLAEAEVERRRVGQDERFAAVRALAGASAGGGESEGPDTDSH